jgi:plasmid maintenance system antidote protein VapI
VERVRRNEVQGEVMRVRDPHALRAYLRLLGLSERALAARAGVAPATVNHLVSGRRRGCTPRTATAIETALACPDGLFFEASTRVGPRRSR